MKSNIQQISSGSKIIIILFLFFSILSTAFAQVIPSDSLYLGQTRPGNVAQIFAPNIISKSDRLEHGGVFTSNGTEFYYSVDVNSTGASQQTYVRKYVNSRWSAEEISSFSSILGGAAEAFLYKHDSCVIFVSSNGTTSDGWIKTDFWYANRKGTDWDNPKELNTSINNIDVQWHPTISNLGNMFFGSRGIIYQTAKINDYTFGEPTKFNDNKINLSGSGNGDPFIAPDESYLIFVSSRMGGYGQNDLYISFKKKDETWTNPQNLGPNINSDKIDYNPYLSPDSKYLLFSRRNGTTNCDIYWVSANIIEELRKQTFTSAKGLEKPDAQTIEIFPNPSSGIFNINIGDASAQNAKVEIHDFSGKLMLSKELENGVVDLTSYQKGIYVAKIVNGNKVFTEKLVIK